MKAGPELDALVAMKVLGLHEEAGWWKNDAGEVRYPACVGCMGESTWSPSIDIAAAWQVVEKLADMGYIVSVCWGPGGDGRRYASIQMQLNIALTADLAFRNPRGMDAVAETVPLAICLAALKAVGVELVIEKDEEVIYNESSCGSGACLFAGG